LALTAVHNAHQRKAIAGDWRNYFSERVKQAFKARYGDLLVASGYALVWGGDQRRAMSSVMQQRDWCAVGTPMSLG
jgi:hypothetical protein